MLITEMSELKVGDEIIFPTFSYLCWGKVLGVCRNSLKLEVNDWNGYTEMVLHRGNPDFKKKKIVYRNLTNMWLIKRDGFN